MSKHHLPYFLLSTALLLSAATTGCSQPTTTPSPAVTLIDLSATTLPAVAAEFITSRQDDEHNHEKQDAQHEPVTWRFWRNDQEIRIERPQLGIGELWQQDGHSLIHRKLYHADQRAIEFEQSDLNMLQALPSWQKLALLLDKDLLAQLKHGDIEWRDGIPTREYQGNLNGTDWHIVMRLDLALPLLIEQHSEHAEMRTELRQAYLLPMSPWQPTPTQGYDVIDYADLGDKEYDPFVIKVQAQMGHDHAH